MDEMFCKECGDAMFITTDGIAHHSSTETPDGIDHDADADHVAIADTTQPTGRRTAGQAFQQDCRRSDCQSTKACQGAKFCTGTVNGRMLVVQHMFPIGDIKPGQTWAYADGSDGTVTVTAVNYDDKDVTYFNSRSGSSHTKDSFAFQTRYCMVVG